MERLLRITRRGTEDRAFLIRRIAGRLEALAGARRRKGDDAGARRAVSRRAELLAELVETHPQHHRMDEILLALGAAEEALGRTKRARRALLRLVRTVPGSPLASEAYATLGDLSEARAARRWYDRAIRTGTPRIRAYACYRRAHLHWRAGLRTEAARDFARAGRIATTSGGDERWALQIARAANADRARLHGK